MGWASSPDLSPGVPGRGTGGAGPSGAPVDAGRGHGLRDVSDRLGRAMEGRLMAAIKGKPTEGP